MEPTDFVCIVYTHIKILFPFLYTKSTQIVIIQVASWITNAILLHAQLNSSFKASLQCQRISKVPCRPFENDCLGVNAPGENMSNLAPLER